MKKILVFFICLLSICLYSCNEDRNISLVSTSKMKPHLITISQTSADKVTTECLPSVVAISAENDKYQSVGSGVCVADKGLIVTNYHVVNGSKKIYLYLADGEVCNAKLLWKDKSLDLAIIQSEKSIPWLKIADTGSYSSGEEVIAIGTPIDLNFKHSVTKGIISATNRSIQVDGEDGYSYMTNLLQHDASINPGNSGGPLLNTKGEIIGINTIKVEDAEGLGFAIVCDTITPVIENFKKYQSHSNGFLGIFGYDVSLDTFGSKDYGLKIVSIDKNSPLNELNSIKEGDVITKINGKKVKDYLMLKKELYKYKAGDIVNLEIKSNNTYTQHKIRLTENTYCTD